MLSDLSKVTQTCTNSSKIRRIRAQVGNIGKMILEIRLVGLFYIPK